MKRLELIEQEITRLERVCGPRRDLEGREGAARARHGRAEGRDREDQARDHQAAARRQARQGGRAAVRQAAGPGGQAQGRDRRRSEASKSSPTSCCARGVGAEEIAEVVSRATGIPVSRR
ncbi:hypothetical protein ACTMU2_02210 [Cupriavidus basilensis]